MARAPTPQQPYPASLSTAQMRDAIQKIERRIADVEAFDPNSVNDRSDPRISAIENRLKDLLEGLFSRGTIENTRYRGFITAIDKAPIIMGGTPLPRVVEGLHQGKATVLHHLKEIVAKFEEELNDQVAAPTRQALQAYQNLDLHQEIQRASGDLYRNGHYANAIEDAVKALNALVRLRSGEDSKGGSNLMEHVFSPKKPILKFNDLADQSDLEEQKGFMMMFSGVVAGLRNPRAHKIIKDDPESALEFIAFVSLLAKLVDRAKK